MSEANNYVCFNVDQSGNHSEPTRLRARNNIGAAGLSSLSASFESRAPSYVWSAGEVCTYGGKLWMFDADHSGAWTGADAHEVDIDSLITGQIINLTSWEDVTNKLGHLESSLLEGRVVILYNKALEQLDVSFWARFSTSTNTIRKIFHFNNDIPVIGSGAEQHLPDNHVFGGDVLGRAVAPSLTPQLGTVRPFAGALAELSNAISFRGDVYYSYCDSFWRIFQVSKNLVGAFNEYLGL